MPRIAYRREATLASAKLAVGDAARSGELAQLPDSALVPLAQARGLALELIRCEIFVGKRGDDIVPLHCLVDAQDDQRLIELGQLLAEASDRRLHVGTEIHQGG